MESEHVYIDPDTKITVTKRRLIEIDLPDDLDSSENGEIIGYLESHLKGKGNGSIYPHPDCGIQDFSKSLASKIEGFFWIPDTEEILKDTYKDAPTAVMNALKAAFIVAKENGFEDYGFALIGFF